MDKEMVNVLIACTGSVATIKLPEIVTAFRTSERPKFAIKIIVTNRAKHFLNANDERPDDLLNDVEMLDDESEWSAWTKRGDPVLHIDLTKWADVMVVAPLDANTLAKIANGLCDNLLLCTVRAWQLKIKPILFAPAMNTFMWEHPITSQHIAILKSWGYHEISCISKRLMCGDTGMGAMALPEDILTSTIASLVNI